MANRGNEINLNRIPIEAPHLWNMIFFISRLLKGGKYHCVISNPVP
jgi:hypothetical protein